MLPSQRALFDIPDQVCYLNAAAVGPLPRAVKAAGEAGVARKVQPWAIEPGDAQQQFERARAAAARLINAEPDDVALISSVSYGIATAGKVLTVPTGTRVLLLQDDHSSPVLEWLGRAEAQGFIVEVVPRPDDGDWTAALLAAIGRPGAPPVGMASISSVHWSDGGAVDLERVAAALKAQGAQVRHRCDARRRRDEHRRATARSGFPGVPDLQVGARSVWPRLPLRREALAGRRAAGADRLRPARDQLRTAPYMRDTGYVADARRFDMGERDHFISLEMASIGMEMMAAWGSERSTSGCGC